MRKSRDKINYTLTQRFLQTGNEKWTNWRNVKNNDIRHGFEVE